MDSRAVQVQWAVLLAALVGGVSASFVAPSMVSLGIWTGGNRAILAGEAAIYVSSLTGAVLGTAVGAVTAIVVCRTRPAWVGSLGGSVAGIGIGVVVGYFSENIALAWFDAFSSNPLEAALVGGAIAGGFAGIAAAVALRALAKMGAAVVLDGKFAALTGSILGLLAGLGGGSIGATLVDSLLACPNGFFTNPYTTSGCVPGLLQGSLLVGLWAGAATGAIAAVGASSLLRRLQLGVAAPVPTN